MPWHDERQEIKPSAPYRADVGTQTPCNSTSRGPDGTGHVCMNSDFSKLPPHTQHVSFGPGFVPHKWTTEPEIPAEQPPGRVPSTAPAAEPATKLPATAAKFITHLRF